MAIIDKPSDYFNTKLYTGDGDTASNKTGVGFQPDFTWIKKRTDDAEDHALFDSVRGVSSPKLLNSNGTGAEETHGNNGYVSGFLSDGFSIATNGTSSEKWEYLNTSGDTFASWNWKAGTSFTNDASATGIGTIDSTGSASDTSGFSIVSYSGIGSAGTIKHGLSTVPKMIILRRINTAENWLVYNAKLGAGNYLLLNTTGASAADTGMWNNTSPTSSVFSVGSEAGQGASGGTYIVYCFAEKQGYSKFGSYTGNGSTDGTFVYTGFKPAFVMLKRTDTTGNWVMVDSKRDTFNVCDALLSADTSDGEYDIDAEDFLSNGFKMRDTHATRNASGGSYIYMAFAENPLVASNFVPTTAR